MTPPLTLYLEGIPPSVNHYWKTAGHRRYVSKAGVEFQERFGWMLKAACAPEPIPRFPGRVHVAVSLRPVTLKRRPDDIRPFDPDNTLKVLLDCLKLNRVIVDDSCKYIRRLTVTVEDATDTARTTVTVEEMADDTTRLLAAEEEGR